MRAIIFANGELNDTDQIRSINWDEYLIIAADGGARHCLALDLIPAIIIGDFDSLTLAEQAEFVQKGSKIIRHPERKDHTDLELAMLHAISSGAVEILVLGALGRRWDQTLANLLIPASPLFSEIAIRMLDGDQEINLIRARQKLELYGNPGDTVSLIPLWGDALGVYTQGLEYPLNNETLKFGSTRGISNMLTQPTALVEVDEGLLVCIVIRKDLK
jgi:thiamine pyrophosphokinase